MRRLRQHQLMALRIDEELAPRPQESRLALLTVDERPDGAVLERKELDRVRLPVHLDDEASFAVADVGCDRLPLQQKGSSLDARAADHPAPPSPPGVALVVRSEIEPAGTG